MKWRNTGKYAAIIIAALMLSMMVLASGVNVLADRSDGVYIENVQVRKLMSYDGTYWRFYGNMEERGAMEGDAIQGLVCTQIDKGATSASDAASRSRISMTVAKGGATVYTWTPTSTTWFYSDEVAGWAGYSTISIPNIATDAPITITTTLEIHEGGAWTTHEVWINYIGEAQPIVYGDYLLDVSLSFTFGDIPVRNGDTVRVRENGTLSGVRATGMIGNGSKPLVFYDQTTSYLDVSLIDYKGHVTYSDIVWEVRKEQMPNSYYWHVEYEHMDIVQNLLRFNEAYTIQIEMYTINEDWHTFTVHDRWAIYLDNDYMYIPPEDEQFAVISGALGFIGVIGFVGSPMLMAAMMRRGMESTKAIPYLLMLMVASGVLAYVFLLGGD